MDQKLFQVSKAITKQLAKLNKSIEGLFSDTEEILDLKDLRHYTEEVMNTTNQEELISVTDYCKAIILDVRGK